MFLLICSILLYYKWIKNGKSPLYQSTQNKSEDTKLGSRLDKHDVPVVKVTQ